MSERRQTIGEILAGFGRISDADVTAALQYQEKHGGYFGEALLALGCVTREELEWGLASQFDLPYVFPDADAIDPEAAALVTPHWALRHLALPIMTTESTITVVVDSPARTDAIRELQLSSGMEVELALAPASKIRELIRRVYGDTRAAERTDSDDRPVSVADFLSTVMDEGAVSFGVSVRDARVVGWYRRRGFDRKRVLTAGWRGDLDHHMIPSPSSAIEGGNRAEWRGFFEWGDRRQAVDARFMKGASGMEFAFRPVSERLPDGELLSPPPTGILSEIALLADAGAARFLLTTTPPTLARDLLPRLPSLVLEPLARSVHLSHAPAEESRVFAVQIPRDAEARAEAMRALEPYHFDAVTVALEAPVGDGLEQVLDLAPVLFLMGDGETPIDRAAAGAAGVDWELSVHRRPGDRLEWAIRPLQP